MDAIHLCEAKDMMAMVYVEAAALHDSHSPLENGIVDVRL